jgi:hypothetical protein
MGLLARRGVSAALRPMPAAAALLAAPLWRLPGAGRPLGSAALLALRTLSRGLLPAPWFLLAGSLLALWSVPFACRSTVWRVSVSHEDSPLCPHRTVTATGGTTALARINPCDSFDLPESKRGLSRD